MHEPPPNESSATSTDVILTRMALNNLRSRRITQASFDKEQSSFLRALECVISVCQEDIGLISVADRNAVLHSVLVAIRRRQLEGNPSVQENML